MKKILFITSFICLLGFTSCDSFLEENPRSEISTDSFFKSAADGYASVNILYRKGLPSFYDAGSAYMGPTIMFGGYKSGLYDNQYKGMNQFIQYCQNLDIDASVSNTELQSMWEPVYEAIVREANYAIKYLPTCPGLSETERKQLLAEAKFFRAINYFWLVKMFGPVPIIEQPYESLDNLYIPRSTEAKVYEFIVTDLEDALANGGLNDASMPKNAFRISKGSVAALLADVYLNMTGYPLNDTGKYADALRVSKLLLNNSNYKLIQHINMTNQSAYNILRTSDVEDEYLYTVEYDASIDDGGWRPAYCFPNDAATWGEFTYNITTRVYAPVKTLFAAYDSISDLRRQERQYFFSEYTQTKGTSAGTIRQFGESYPYFWFEETALLETRRSQKDQVHYRLAEIYLIAAEAIAQTSGVTDEAADLLATIQARAFTAKTKDQIKTDLMALSKQDFVQEVWREKIRELIFENKLWNDITRTQMYPSISGNKLTFVNLVGAQNPWGKTFQEKDQYFPICSQEIQRNPALAEDPI